MAVSKERDQATTRAALADWIGRRAGATDVTVGVARGAEMLSLMLGFGIVSRVASGWIADQIGALRTLLVGSFLQGCALFLYLWFDGLTSLYVISALFGLFQGGIVPSYALIVREYFPAREAGAPGVHLAVVTKNEKAIAFYDPRVVVFDGNVPYQGLIEARASHPNRPFVWLRRGMWRADAGRL